MLNANTTSEQLDIVVQNACLEGFQHEGQWAGTYYIAPDVGAFLRPIIEDYYQNYSRTWAEYDW